MSRVLTTCIYCGCGCGLYLIEDKGRVIGAYPSQNHPVSKGSLCVKGWNSYEFIHSPERLKKPLIRKRDSGLINQAPTVFNNGKFKEIDWERALNLVSQNLLRIKERYGPHSLAFLSSAKTTNEENFLMMKLARAVFGTNNVDHCARLCHASTVIGLASTFGSGAMTNSISEFEDAEVFLVTGSDTTEQHPLIGSRIINAVHKGAKLILIDPRKIELAKYAEIYLSPKNGTDVAWINGLMHVIIKEGLEAREYIDSRTEGFEELKELTKEYTPEYVESITNIPKEKLVSAARIYAKTRKAMIVYSMGITQHTTGTDNVKSLANLAMLTAHVGFPSTGVNPLRGQNNVQGACDVGALPDVYSGYQKVTEPASRKKFEKAWKVKLPEEAGLTVTEIIKEAGRKIKGLYIMGENPVISDPDSNKVRESLKKLDFLVVQDIFPSDTAQYADVVLPSASFAEKDGTFTNTERRIERIRKVIEPIGEAKADWEILSEVARKCGYKGMDYKNPSEIMEEISSLTPIYGGISYERLDPPPEAGQAFGLQWPCRTKEDPGTPYLHKEKLTKGKGSFMPRHYIPPDELPDEEYNFLLSTGRIYWHWHTGTMTRRTSILTREVPEAYMELNPEDAKELNLREGEKVGVSSRRGRIEVKVKVTEKVRPKSVFIPFHFREAAANILTNPAVDPVAKIPEYKVSAVKIESI
ncbi:formate dehydrogenase subunit alpha [bacterium]|nr:formate dehydrogenase subunit alpha [bacterium]